jgi:transcriptional regulator
MGYTGGEKLSPWEVSDAPARYIEILKKKFVGIEIKINRLQGNLK